MTILEVQKKYNTQAKCLKLLEKLRWGKVVKCTYCSSTKTKRQKSEKTRHTCKNCKRSFSVFVDTIFEDTRLPLPKWFVVITMMLNSKSGISSKEIQRNIGGSYKTSYYVAMRVRIGMLMPKTQLGGIIEMDESYFGGKARKSGKVKDNKPNLSSVALKRGRGTTKISVAGMVQRKGMVKTKLIEKLTKRNLTYMLKSYAKKENSILITDGFKSYKSMNEYIERLEINHKKEFSRGIVHVNTIEGFWSYVKNGIKGSFKSISKKYLPFYLVEYEWKFNNRNYRGDEFEKYLKNALKQEKSLEYWKAKDSKEVKEIAYN